VSLCLSGGIFLPPGLQVTKEKIFILIDFILIEKDVIVSFEPQPEIWSANFHLLMEYISIKPA